MAKDERKPAQDDQAADDVELANLPEPPDTADQVKGGARAAGAVSDIDSGVKRAVDL